MVIRTDLDQSFCDKKVVVSKIIMKNILLPRTVLYSKKIKFEKAPKIKKKRIMSQALLRSVSMV
jgi:hypothetical protein